MQISQHHLYGITMGAIAAGAIPPALAFAAPWHSVLVAVVFAGFVLFAHAQFRALLRRPFFVSGITAMLGGGLLIAIATRIGVLPESVGFGLFFGTVMLSGLHLQRGLVKIVSLERTQDSTDAS